MKTIGAAIVAATLLVGSIIGDMGLMPSEVDASSWDTLSATGLFVFVLVLAFEKKSSDH